MLDDSERARKASQRARQRAYRARQRRGECVARVVINGRIINMLVQCHWIADKDAVSLAKVDEAIAKLLDDAAS